jgi:hypothetical protein
MAFYVFQVYRSTQLDPFSYWWCALNCARPHRNLSIIVNNKYSFTYVNDCIFPCSVSILCTLSLHHEKVRSNSYRWRYQTTKLVLPPIVDCTNFLFDRIQAERFVVLQQQHAQSCPVYNHQISNLCFNNVIYIALFELKELSSNL